MNNLLFILLFESLGENLASNLIYICIKLGPIASLLPSSGRKEKAKTVEA